jgi:hypothetical protein
LWQENQNLPVSNFLFFGFKMLLGEKLCHAVKYIAKLSPLKSVSLYSIQIQSDAGKSGRVNKSFLLLNFKQWHGKELVENEKY